MFTVQGNSGYWAPFKISQNLPKRSAATRAATWSRTTPAVCGDPQISGMGTVLKWVIPVPLWYLSPLTVGALVGGYREVEAPLSPLPDGPGLEDWRCSMHFLWGKQWTVPSRTDGAPSLRLWYCSSFNQPDYSATHWIQSLLVFLFFLLCIFSLFYPSFTSLPMCTRVWVCFSQNTLQVVGERWADRQMCSNPLAYEYTTPPLTLIYI